MSFYRSITFMADRLLPFGTASSLRAAIRSQRDRKNRLEHSVRRKTWQESAGRKEALSIEIQPGVTFAAYTDSELCRLIYLGGYELDERQFVYRFLQPGDIFVDIGANVGLYSLLASRAVGTGKVYAFEPCSSTHARLLGNLGDNGMTNVHAQQVAISDSDGELTMFTSTDGFDAWNSAGSPAGRSLFRQEEVACMRWDSFISQENLRGRVALVKVDIEGWEGRFLAGGAMELGLPGAPTLLIELNDDAAESAGTSVDRIRDQLLALGYVLYCPTVIGADLTPFSYTSGTGRSRNVIAVKNLQMVLGRVTNSPAHDRMR